MRKFMLTSIVIFCTMLCSGQNTYNKEFSFITDNDLYTSTQHDRYYTSGIFITYKYASRRANSKLQKKIIEFGINHEMFTPKNAIVLTKQEQDRPFAANLYANYSINRIYKNGQSLKSEITLGTIGPNALGEQLQNTIHAIYNYPEAVGWRYQIKNALNVNINHYYNTFLYNTKNNHLDISWINKFRVGTVYTDLQTGVLTRIGVLKLADFANTIAFDTHLNTKTSGFKSVAEAFFYIKSTVRYALYDATLQGSFFTKENMVTNSLIPFVFNIDIGFKATLNRFNFGYTYHYNTNKSRGLEFNNGQVYGTVALSYLF